MQLPAVLSQPRQRRGDIFRGNLQIDASPERMLHRPCHPAAHTRLCRKHDLRLAHLEIGKSLVRALIGDTKSDEAAPEMQAAVEVRNNQFGDQARPAEIVAQRNVRQRHAPSTIAKCAFE